MLKKRGAGVTHVSKLFEKYTKTLQAPQKIVVTECIDVINDLFNIKIPREQCVYSVRSKTLSIHTKGVIKTEITLRKKDILNHLKARLGEKSAPNEIL